MKKSEALKIIKCCIRNNSVLLSQWKDEEISFGRMSEELSKSILHICENYIKMIPPLVKTDEGYNIELCAWEKENDQ